MLFMFVLTSFQSVCITLNICFDRRCFFFLLKASRLCLVSQVLHKHSIAVTGPAPYRILILHTYKILSLNPVSVRLPIVRSQPQRRTQRGQGAAGPGPLRHGGPPGAGAVRRLPPSHRHAAGTTSTEMQRAEGRAPWALQIPQCSASPCGSARGGWFLFKSGQRGKWRREVERGGDGDRAAPWLLSQSMKTKPLDSVPLEYCWCYSGKPGGPRTSQHCI
ncbi:uncharacterized protein LOC104914046 isoform X2 [Meleagris gallopavo]|uniref:uncharacterized protein LOC104914046 isoform X2 n=1 Tax=Meleagris gallopavo TaxID=9103 RepID=UPI0012ABAE71|nr:uncharacterized protein LOC104914046 isoform X2 [Meleagris gallopavo]